MNNIRRVALLFAVITPVHAAPITYNINFNTGSGIAPVSGGFTYDGSTSTFTSFTVIWDGMTFDFTRPLRAGLDTCGVPQTEAGEFQLLMGDLIMHIGQQLERGCR